MNKKAKISLIFALAVGMLVGAFLFSKIEIHVKSNESEASPSALQSQVKNAVVPAKEREIRTLKDFNDAFVDIAQSTKPSVVTVFTEQTISRRAVNPFQFFGFDQFFQNPNRGQAPTQKELRKGLGSGVVVSHEGYILTNNHVIDNADTIYVRTHDERTLPAKVIGADPKTDIAVIKVEDDELKPIKIGNSDKLRVGEWVIAIGSPLGENLAETVTQGIVSAKGRANVGLADYEDYIQTDAAINPGNSGGPLVNINGELIGINTAIASRTGGFQGVGFAVPSNMARKVMQSLIEYGKVTRGWLGVTIQDVNESIAKGMDLETKDGVLIGSVLNDSPADKAGLKTGDVIVALNGKRVKNTVELRNNIAGTAPGTSVRLTLVREGREKTVRVKLGQLPSDDALANVSSSSSESMKELLGFAVSSLNRELAAKYQLDADEKGVVITQIDRSSMAFREGLREGDLILAINKVRIESISEFEAQVKKTSKGDTALFLIERKGSKLFIAFSL